MNKNIALIIFFLFLSCAELPMINNKIITKNNFSEIKKQTIKNFFEIKYSLDNVNSVASNEKDRCTINYEITNISNISMYASITIVFKSKGVFSKDAYILAGILAPSQSAKGFYTFEKIPCDYLEELSFIY